MIKGWKNLAKKERKHLIDMGINNTFLFQKNIDEQENLYRLFGDLRPCWDCFFIAKKLGFEPKGGWFKC